MDLSKIPGKAWVVAGALMLAIFGLFSGLISKLGFTPNWGLFVMLIWLFLMGSAVYYIIFNKFGLDKAGAFLAILVLVVLGFAAWKVFPMLDYGSIFSTVTVNNDLQSVMSVFGG